MGNISCPKRNDKNKNQLGVDNKNMNEQVQKLEHHLLIKLKGNESMLIYMNLARIKEINLKHCKLVNIQNLTFLKTQFLKIIDLTDNFICSLSPLKKLKSKGLQELYVKYNWLYDNEKTIKTLTRIQYSQYYFDLRVQTEFTLYSDRYAFQCQFQDLSYLVKTQKTKRFDLSKKINGRINQQKVLDIFQTLSIGKIKNITLA